MIDKKYYGSKTMHPHLTLKGFPKTQEPTNIIFLDNFPALFKCGTEILKVVPYRHFSPKVLSTK